MKLTKQLLTKIIKASTILGTGGGGRLDSALELIRSIKSVELVSADKITGDGYIITAYGAGGLTKTAIKRTVIQQAQGLLQQQLDQPIVAVIPVEIGPYSLATAFDLAATLGVPVVDGDLVGYRSVPEIFIELPTLARLQRCPMVIANNEGDFVVLEKLSSDKKIEAVIRNFAGISASNTYVLGYPFNNKQLSRGAAFGSISYCLNLAGKLDSDFSLIAGGRVTSDQKREVNGFTAGQLLIEAEDGSYYKLVYKNEYLLLSRNNKLVVTCPDLICAVDTKTMLGLNNGNNNQGKQVNIYVKPAIQQWRTQVGLELFSPRRLGLKSPQRIWEKKQ